MIFFYKFRQFLPTTSKDYFVDSATSCPLEAKTKQGGFFSRLFSRESVVTATWVYFLI